MYITDQDSLELFAKEARGCRVLAIDTEFLREKTYYPKLCLLQLSADDKVAVVDPFSIVTFDPLKPLFEDEATVKLFHAGGEGEHRNARACEHVAHGGNRTVAAAGDDGIEGCCVVEHGCNFSAAIGCAHAHLVAVAYERSDEIVDGAFAVSRLEVVDDEQFHRTPFCCYHCMVLQDD